MKDQRVQAFRGAVDGLIESLEATVRLSRWSEREAKPPPLVQSAAQLGERLGTASRLATSRFHGTAAEVGKVDAMRAVLRRLDEAYVVYRKGVGLVEPVDDAASVEDATTALETALVDATAQASGWR